MNRWRLTEVVTLGSVGAFFLTLVYFNSYSREVGIDLLSLFSINDYFRQSVVWLAPTVISWIIGYFVGQVIFPPKEVTPEDVAKQGNVLAFFYPAQRFIIFATFGATLYQTGKAYYQNNFPASLYLLWTLSGFFLWILLFLWWIGKPEARAKLGKEMAIFLCYYPAMIIYVYFNAKYAVRLEKAIAHPPVESRIMIEGEKNIFVGKILFVLDEVIVVLDSENSQTKAIPRNHVKEIIWDN